MPKIAGERYVIENKEIDTLFLNYRDPFLGTVPRIVRQSPPRVRAKVTLEEPDSPPDFNSPGEYERGNRIIG